MKQSCIYKVIVCTLVLVAAFFTKSVAAEIANNASISVTRSDTRQPVPDAVVKVVPLDIAHRNKDNLGFTNVKGIFNYTFSEPVIIQVSHLGFITITDTLLSPENKTYILDLNYKNVQDVVVTGQYGNNNVQKSVYDVKVINADMLRAKGANNLREALQNELSIDLGQDQVFGSTLSINGISGEGVKILVDGVPIVGRLDGKLDLSQISISNIDHIEIVEGPLSVTYGTDAMGGVINIITKNFQREKININLKGYYESVGQYNAELNAGFAFKRSQFYVSGGRNFFGGYTTLDSIPRYKEWKPKEQYFADAKYIYTANRFHFSLAASFFRELMLDRSAPFQTLAPGDTSWTYSGIDMHYLTYRPMGSASFSYRFKENYLLEVLLGYSGFIRYTNTYNKNLVSGSENIVPDQVQDTTRYNHLTFRSTYNMPAWKNRLNFQFGVDINQEYDRGTLLLGNKQQIGDYAAFGGARITAIEGLDIQPAIRFSYNTRFQVPLIPSLNIRYIYKEGLVVRASVGRGYRAPGVKELFLDFFDSNHDLKGNQDLKPEDGINVSSSISYTQPIKATHKVTITASGFYNNIHNKIDLVLTDSSLTPNLYQYFNINHYITYGGQLSLAYHWNRLQLSVAGMSTSYDISNPATQSGTVKMWSPDFKASAGYVIPKAEIGINITYKYNGQKPLYSVTNSIDIGTRPGYHWLDASLTRNFWKDRIQLTVGGKNLIGVTNLTGSNVGGVSQAHNASPNDLNIAWGRTFFTTLVLHFSR
ncbi:MAG: hypothetical protein JWO06_872 [Bacteroidota bacterium]|nr:hypothetical protein [Bacteroidota bacterium]